ncbi:MAG: hypothetical protein J5501_05335 [Ruminococcus sp.]|nr:hypothetical protein [Ruminococcus sp.]
MKRIISSVLAALCVLSLASCGYSDARKKAEEKMEKYGPAFEQAVRDAYGDDVEIRGMRSSVDGYTDGAFQTSFSAGALTGRIKLDGKTYKVQYNDLSHTLYDNVHSDAIAGEVIDSLPFDASKYIKKSCPLPMLESDIDSLSKLVSSGTGVRFKVAIVTTEDMSSYKDKDFLAIPKIKEITESDSCNICITVACLERRSAAQAKSLLNAIAIGNVHFSSGTHPNISTRKGPKDVFEEYDLKNVLYIDFANGQNVVFTGA